MKTIEMIYRVTCRYCRQAFGLMEELRRSNEKYEKIEIRFLDTERDRELLAGRKIHLCTLLLYRWRNGYGRGTDKGENRGRSLYRRFRIQKAEKEGTEPAINC